MAYYDIAKLADDLDFFNRVAACYAVETWDKPDAEDPFSWARARAWVMAARPSFGEAYAANQAPNPGRNPNVITDAMILAAVRALLAG